MASIGGNKETVLTMGKFVLDYSSGTPILRDESGREPQFTFVVAEPPRRDSPFQKALCYASYYTMTFCAFCTFTPHKVAYAAEMIKATIPG